MRQRRKASRWGVAVLASVSLAASLPACLAAAERPNRLALVIGNAAYSALPSTPYCTASANLAGAALERAGFTVTKLLNPSNAQLGTAIVGLGDAVAAAPGGAAVIYACGYAAAFDGRLFLLPVSANLLRDTDVLTQGVVGRLLASSVFGTGAAAGLILLDAPARPGEKLAFDSLVSAANTARGGLAGLQLARPPAGGAAPLAQGLSDALAAGDGEVGAILRRIAASPDTAGPNLTVVRPTAPAVLLAAPAAAAPPAPVAAAEPSPPAMAAPATPDPAPPPATPAPQTPADRRRVQLALQRMGYYLGRVTGVYGLDSFAAIRRYQRENGGEATGRLTPAQTEQLLRDGR